MKRMIIIIFLFSAVASLFGQKAAITISHTVTYDSISVLPDSIIVTNLTQGGDTTLYGADTTLVLDYTTGLFDYQKGGSDLRILPNYPNPFTSLTYFDVVIPESGELIIKVYDISGKETSGFSGSYMAGSHQFSLVSSETGLYIIHVAFKNETSSIRIQSIGGFSERKNEINYLGIQSSGYNHKSTAAINSFGFNIGDQLRSEVFYQILTDTTEYTPTQDTLIKVKFQNPSLCPATFTDIRDNHVYSAVQIGTQCWMAENLAYLPSVSPSNQGSNYTPYYYVYSYHGTDTSAAKAYSTYDTYGVLYNWYAAMAGQASSNSVPSGVQGVCPAGWHLPSDEEWKILEGEVDSQYGYPDPEWDNIGMRGADAGGNLKEVGLLHWNSPNNGATNNSGFTALPGGYRFDNGNFANMGNVMYVWTSTEYDPSNGLYRVLYYSNTKVARYYYQMENGYAVRCIKN